MPSFSNNSEYFKYHESSLYNNSFFLYFTPFRIEDAQLAAHSSLITAREAGVLNEKRCNRIQDIDDLSKYKQYFLLMGVINDYPFFGYGIPAMNHEPGRKYIQHFNKNYEFIANTEIIQIFQNIKKNAKIFGIHIRSLEQKRVHHNDYLAISIQDRLHRVKEQLDAFHGCNNYSIYIMTDISFYIDIAKAIFTEVYYFENITRIGEEHDIITRLPLDKSGYKLGSDILNECFALSLCDKIYVSNSNIVCLVSQMNPNIIMELY